MHSTPTDEGMHLLHQLLAALASARSRLLTLPCFTLLLCRCEQQDFYTNGWKQTNSGY